MSQIVLNQNKINSAAAEISAEGVRFKLIYVGQAWFHLWKCTFHKDFCSVFKISTEISTTCVVASPTVLVQGETSLWIVCPRGVQSVEHLPQGLHLCGVLVTGSLVESDSHTKV